MSQLIYNFWFWMEILRRKKILSLNRSTNKIWILVRNKTVDFFLWRYLALIGWCLDCFLIVLWYVIFSNCSKYFALKKLFSSNPSFILWFPIHYSFWMLTVHVSNIVGVQFMVRWCILRFFISFSSSNVERRCAERDQKWIFYKIPIISL